MRTRTHRSLGLPLALSLLTSAPLFAQEFALAALSAPVDELSHQEWAASARPQDAEDLARSVRRILHLRSGQTLIGVARHEGGQWQIKLGGSWQSLPEGQVVRHPKEADVLREKKRLEKDVRTTQDVERQLAFAQWLAGEGLGRDALLELDRLLDSKPHHAGALEFLRTTPLIRIPSLDVPADELPAAKAELMRWAAQAPVAARELAIGEFAKLEDTDGTKSELLEGLGEFSVRRRAFCAQGLGRLYPGQEAKRLLVHSILDASGDVRRAAAQALGGAEEPSLIVPVARALGSTNPRVRTQAAEALGYMGYPAAVEPLVGYVSAVTQSGGSRGVPHGYYFHGIQRAYVQDFDVEVATFQAVADPQINVLIEGEILEGGVQSVSIYDRPTELRSGRGALQRLTGANPGRTGRDWMRWWDENESDWKDKNFKREPVSEN